MATRSTIAILNNDGSCEGVYCHWDGYLTNNGKILKTAYDTKSKVRELLSNGDISTLDSDMTDAIFYHRDHNEDFDDVQARKVASLKDLPLSEEYNYVFDVSKNEWLLNWDNELISFEATQEFENNLYDY